MGAMFWEDDRWIKLDVLCYEIPDDIPYDSWSSNWLLILITLFDGNGMRSYRSNCLLADELAWLAQGIDAVLEGREAVFDREFFEPLLSVYVEAEGDIEDTYHVEIRFRRRLSKEEGFFFSLDMSKENLCKANKGLWELSRQFPYRGPKQSVF